MATLKIVNNLEFETDGETITGKAGPSSVEDISEPYEVTELTMNGKCHKVVTSLATGAGVTIWDEDDDSPSDWQYLHVRTDENMYIQLIGQTSQVSANIYANIPFNFTGDQILAAANTTPLAAAPSLEDIDSVRIWNESGNTGKIVAEFCD